MTIEQVIVFLVLSMTLCLFIWGRLRYDLVAVISMIILVVSGIVPSTKALQGFGHPAVITVAAVLIISHALRNSGLVDMVVNRFMQFRMSHSIQVILLTGFVSFCSAFMNNVGALALMLPIAISMAHKQETSPSILLMPIAFGSILGGLVTMFGTPPNIIIATYRYELTGQAFNVFDFTPVGIVVALVGLLFISFIGWRLIPDRGKSASAETLFEIHEYTSELRIKENSPLVGKLMGSVDVLNGSDIVTVGFVSDKKKVVSPSRWRALKEGDILIVRADPNNLKKLITEQGLELLPGAIRGLEDLQSEDVQFIEALVTADSSLAGRDLRYLRRRTAGQVNMVAVARQGHKIAERLRSVQFKVGDLLLLQGEKDILIEAQNILGLLPLAERDLKFSQSRKAGISLVIFLLGILAGALNLVDIPIAFITVIGIYVLFDILSPRELYKSIDWPIVVLLGGMMSVGYALESTNTTTLIANAIVFMTAEFPHWVVLGVVMILAMVLSDFINNAATALVMAPIAVGVAENISVSSDPFLMAVAIGASCAFLTPIGHQSNTLVMGPGGYRFGDYWRMGLPLQILIFLVGLPMIIWIWPL